MLERNRPRKGGGDLLDTLFKLFASSDLEVDPGLQKVHPAIGWCVLIHGSPQQDPAEGRSVRLG